MLDSIIWKDGAASYEDYLERQREIERMEQGIHDLRIYQTDVLGAARGRMTNDAEPPSKKEL